MYFTASHYPRGFTKKTLLILQLTTVLFLCTCLTASAGKLGRRAILSADNMKKPIKVSDLLYLKNVSPTPFAIITGTVKDALGNPLVGVSVIVKGTQKGTSTSADGSFSIDANAGDVLEFTIVGYQKQEVSIGQNKNLTVVMEVEAIAASEVVVVGY